MAADQTNYLAAFLQSPGNVTGVLAGAASAAVLSFPFGLIGAALPLLITLGVEVLACLFVPDMASFRRWADDHQKQQRRTARSQRLLAELRKRCANHNQLRLLSEAYHAIESEVHSVLSLAHKRSGVLSLEDLERIADVPAAYLGQQLSLLVMDERGEAVDLREVSRKLEQIDKQIKDPGPGADLRQLGRARDEYRALIQRQQRMLSSRPAIEAAMLALPDQLAEIYQMLMSEDAAGNGERLSDAVSRLRLKQDIEAEISAELSAVLPPIHSPSQAQAAKAAALKQG